MGRDLLIKLFNYKYMSSRVGKIYFCAICGNEVEFVKDGGAPIICCGEAMQIKKGKNEE